MIACGCGKAVEQARIELNLKRCKQCAFSDDVERPKGVMIYSHKTGAQVSNFSNYLVRFPIIFQFSFEVSNFPMI